MGILSLHPLNTLKHIRPLTHRESSKLCIVIHTLYSSQYVDESRDRQPSIVESLQNYSDYYLSTDFSVLNKDLGILTKYARYVICFWLIKISTPIAHILHTLVLDEYMIRRLQVLSATRLYIFFNGL